MLHTILCYELLLNDVELGDRSGVLLFRPGADERLQPSPVVTLNRAVAVAKVRGAADALAMIELLAPQLSGYFQFFGLKGALLAELARADEARVAFDRAIALANTAAEAAHIRMHLDSLLKEKFARM